MKDPREILVNYLAEKLYFPFIKRVYKPDTVCPDLQYFPKGSLGCATFEFITSRGLKLMPGYELHDIKHCVLDIETNLKGEILMQYFEWGNGNRSITVMVVIVLGPFIMPEAFKTFYAAYKRGKAAHNLESYNLMQNLHLPLQDIKKNLNI